MPQPRNTFTVLKFVGRYASLKHYGFSFKLLYDNRIHYTTYETGSKSDVWIQKEHGGLVHFQGMDSEMSAAVYKFLAENHFQIPDGDYNYNTELNRVEKVNRVLQWGVMENDNPDMVLKSMRYIKTHRDIDVRYGTFETLKALWRAGLLSVTEQTF